MGDDTTWEHLEQSLIQSLDAMKLEYRLNPGEGAFYGPKLEFVLRDAIGRDWQCGTLQVDMMIIAPLLFVVFTQMGFAPDIIMHMALGTSLATIIVTSVSSSITHHKKGAVIWPLFRNFALELVIGSFFRGSQQIGLFASRTVWVTFRRFLHTIEELCWGDRSFLRSKKKGSDKKSLNCRSIH